MMFLTIGEKSLPCYLTKASLRRLQKITLDDFSQITLQNHVTITKQDLSDQLGTYVYIWYTIMNTMGIQKSTANILHE